MNKILTELPGILFQMDDICIFEETKKPCSSTSKQPVNPEQPKFQGHVIDQAGIQDKTMKAIPPKQSHRDQTFVYKICATAKE